MIVALIKIIKTIICSLPFLVLLFANAKINLNKSNRSRQFLMPLVALVYCVLGVTFLDFINNLVFKLFVFLGQSLPFLTDLSWQFVMTFVLNAVLVLGFIVVKFFVLPILSGLWKIDKLAAATSGWFYEKEDDVDKWLLKIKFANFRGFIKGIYYAAFIVSTIIFVMSQSFPEAIFFQAAFYPVFGIIILGEVVYFLCGVTKAEFVEDILGEDEESYKVANYGVLRDILRDLFADRVLYENTCDTSDGIATTFEELEEMESSEDPSVKLLGSFYSNLRASGVEVDINYVRSSMDLLNGKSTLFCNPFYRDLTHYLTLPIVKQLICYKKCLVVLGRDSVADDVKNWLDASLKNFSNTDSLWQAEVLDEFKNASDVGILKFSDLYNLKIQRANKEFLNKVGLVLIVEPSRLLSSGQIGLSLLVNNCEAEGKEIVYCACDRNCDGLVDALSHTLKTSITKVTATVNGGGNNSQMYWDADGAYMHHKIFPTVSRYLGMGTEISAVAMKYQLEETGWIGSEKFPVVDMKWIAGQYHKQICEYANLPATQAAFDRAFAVSSNLWSMEKRENSFLVIEDEFQNLFEITRVFASRAQKQGFINVISENYFLRDYMLEHVDVFATDPKAIPTIVADFARTERNVVLKLIMLMANDMVCEEKIAKELMLCGISFEDPYEKLKELIYKHCHVEDATLSVRFREEVQSNSLNSVVVKYYEINETNDLYDYAQQLKSAYYIAEDEEGDSHYIGSKLYGHVFQMILPGQFMTFDGKYYEVQTVTPLNGVVVRRAADHITGRRYYRQLRRIHLCNWADGVEMGSKRTFLNMEITRGYADIAVETDGYLDMDSYGDFAGAQRVTLNGIPARNYRNKSVLKLKLPEDVSPRVCHTLCLLLNEVFRTTYPETYQYIAALAPRWNDHMSEQLADAMYHLDGVYEDNCIYFIEDSDIDLGLIVSIERNLKRYLEIVADVLTWQQAKLNGKAVTESQEGEEATEAEPEEVVTDGKQQERKGSSGFFGKVKDFFKRLFKRKKKSADNGQEAIDETAEDMTASGEEDDFEANAEDSELRSLNDLATDDIDGEDEELVQTPPTTGVSAAKRCFLKFGCEEIDASLDVEGTVEFLKALGLDKNPLRQVREICEKNGGVDDDYDPHKYGAHLCDFCGVELLGGEYELLKDGRERCNRCSLTAVKKAEDFKALYKTVLRNMEAFYGIKLNVAVKVRTTNAKKIAKHVGTKFEPTPGFDGRVLGFARKDKTGYSLYIENGAPKLAAAATIAHELTHIWQYLNWDDAVLEKKYGKKNMLEIYEGMAKWAEIQYLMLMGEKSYAKRQEITTRLREDAYGRGFIMYAEKYPLTGNSRVTATPFKENPPL